MRVQPIPCLKDNYAYLVVCDATGEAAVVDASESEPVATVIERTGVKLSGIWSTHHHWDHVGGNEAIAARYEVAVWGHASDRGRLPGQTRFVVTGDRLRLGELSIQTIHIPGHTLGAVAYVVEGGGGPAAVFTGDTLFVAGCGRLFEGSPAQMHASLGKLAALDPSTRVYCGHEYTEANLRFARSVEPGNERVVAAAERARQARAEGSPTVPSTIGEELETNPFLRVESAEIRRTLHIPADADDVTAFAAIRKAKDNFR